MSTPPQPTRLRRLLKRAEFLRAARGRRSGRRGFTLQAVETGLPDAGIGLTVTKKTGNSPERNRIKRRLRAAVRASARDFAPGSDYVLVGRREALTEPFTDLVASLAGAIRRVRPGRGSDLPAGAEESTKAANDMRDDVQDLAR
jgi:ribonuclease P protein component